MIPRRLVAHLLEIDLVNVRRFAAVAVVAFLLGTGTGSTLAGTALAPITLQPGQQVTIIAANLPTPAPSPTPPPTPNPTPTSTPTPRPTLTPTPTPGLVVRSFNGTQAQFTALLSDMSIDVIELAAGTRAWDKVQVNVDRTARPLTVRPATGATVTFVGPGKTTEGVFFFGSSSTAKWITFDGFAFDGISLSQCGVFEVRSTSHVTLRNMTFRNLRRDPAYSDKPYKSWAAYISGAHRHDALVLDRWTMLAPAVSRDVSGIQIASGTVPSGSVSLTNIALTNYVYALYAEVPISALTLDGWTLANTGNHSTPASIRFTAAAISGSYRNIHATGSDPLLNQSTGTMVNGGGNSWQ